MMVPEGLPLLEQGSHPSPSEGACIMEYVSVIAGERWSDGPRCVNTTLATVSRHVNDRVTKSTRQSLYALVPRLMGTREVDLETWSRVEREVFRLAADRVLCWQPRYRPGTSCEWDDLGRVDDCEECVTASVSLFVQLVELLDLFESFSGRTRAEATSEQSAQWLATYHERKDRVAS